MTPQTPKAEVETEDDACPGFHNGERELVAGALDVRSDAVAPPGTYSMTS